MVRLGDNAMIQSRPKPFKAVQTRLNRHRFSAACAVVLSCAAAAQGGEIVDFSVEVDGWTMMPIAENGATTHIIAARNEDETLTTDIDVVLYEKTIDGWSGSAYDPSVTKEDAMIDLADEFGLPDPFGGEWHFELDPEDVLEHMMPRVGFGKGFFVTDPLYVIANQIDDPEPLAEGAEDAGLPAGSGAINTGSLSGGGADVGPPVPTDCGCDACIQDAIFAAAEALLSELDMLVEDIHAVYTQELVDRGGCACNGGIVHSRRTNIPVWTCGPWRLIDSTPISGGTGFSCKCERTMTRTITRNCVIVCANSPGCPSFVYIQSRTQTSSEIKFTVGETCSPPAIGICGPPSTSVQTSGWVGSPPVCL